VTRIKPSVDRLLYFTDAMVAIAATLLVLPLVDEASAFLVEHEDATAAGFLSQEWESLLAFGISFAVIARLWVTHHRLFTPVRELDGTLVTLDMLWAFTLVFLPLPTQMTALYSNAPSTVGLYIGTMLASSLLLMGVVLHVRRTPELATTAPPLAGTVATTFLFAVAFVLGTISSSYLPLLLLLLGGVATRALRPRFDPHYDDGSPAAAE
jgi:uncharacterized membrane protein